ncbi:MAG: glycosyltransferase [Candidatus Pacearchaeota archaeon]
MVHKEKLRRISFLIAAHNEEKIISTALENLLNLPYEEYEVIIGLDGCTDNTEDIVRSYVNRSNRFKYFKFNLRKGKSAIINEIIKKASGEIIIINDADWYFQVKDSKLLKKFLSVFDNPKIGGITESFPVEWHESKLRKGNIGLKMVAYSTYFWMEFQKRRYAVKNNELYYAKEPALFMTNIFRKDLYRPSSTLADDFERTADLMLQGYQVVFFNDPNFPRMIASYDKILIRDLFKQKIRTAKARSQFFNKYHLKSNMKNYSLVAAMFILLSGFKKNIFIGFLMFLWLFLAFLASLIAIMSKFDTHDGWKIRIRR